MAMKKPRKTGLITVGSPLHETLQSLPKEKMLALIRLRTRGAAKPSGSLALPLSPSAPIDKVV